MSSQPHGQGADGDGDGTVGADALGVWRGAISGVTAGASSAFASVAASVDSSFILAVVAANENDVDFGANDADDEAADAVFAAGDFTGLFAIPSAIGAPGSRNYRPRRRF
jgi:hypothetical protein